MKPLPIGIQTFRDIIEGGYLYIDKTEYLYNLVFNSKGAYFLSRPRRFGKSLMLSTLEEIFLGNKELFKDLWIYNSEFPWNKYPVIRFDFSKQKATTTDALVEFIQNQLDYIASDYSITFSKEYYYERFEDTLKKIQYWYNGYLFSINGVPVYNPFSFLLLLNSKQFKHHWFETGTPEFLTKLILQNNYDILEFPLHVEEIAFSSYEVDDLSLTPLLFQTGYLTIKDYDRELLVYTLDYPNFEVRQAFSNFLLKKIEKNRLSDSYLIKMIQAIQKDDL